MRLRGAMRITLATRRLPGPASTWVTAHSAGSIPLGTTSTAPARGTADAIRAAATLVGDGPERARAEKYVAEQGLGDVITFVGRLGRAGILDVFAETDVYVQPSVKESFGLAALEARTAGLPVIARSQTGTTQFVHDGVEGLLADDDAGMAGAVVRLGQDRDLLSRLAAHNSTIGPEQAWPLVLQTVKDAYRVAGAKGS